VLTRDLGECCKINAKNVFLWKLRSSQRIGKFIEVWTRVKVKYGKVVPVPNSSTTPWIRIREWRYSSTHSLTSALDGGELSASRYSRSTPKERVPGTHWIGGWVGPRAVLDTMLKRKIPIPRRESNPHHPMVQAVVSRYTKWAIPALSVDEGYV
jgi:hypothetical protein